MPAELTGRRFGDVVVLRKSLQQDTYGQVEWSWVCDCGATGKDTTADLNSSDGKTCGKHPLRSAPVLETSNTWDFTGLEMLGRK